LQENGDFDKMEPFMASTKFNALIDLELGPDGRLYALEYGNGWFSQNADAALSRIDYNAGNRSPVVGRISSDKRSGSLPFAVRFSVDANDPENDALTYQWDLGNGEIIPTKEPVLSHTFREAGDYDVRVRVSDSGKLSAQSAILSVYAGNVAPEVKVNILSNKTFYFPGKPVEYAIEIKDPDDRKALKQNTSLYVSADYVSGPDLAEGSQGHLRVADAMLGKNIVNSTTCITCHKADEPSIGPTFTEIARKYQNNSQAAVYLTEKIQKGGSGVWGETMMPANPDLKHDDAQKIIAYIQSLGQKEAPKPSMPAKGIIADPLLGKPSSDLGRLLVSASFTDRGGKEVKPLSGNGTAVLRHPRISVDQVRDMKGVSTMKFGVQTLLLIPSNEASFSLEEIDLSRVTRIQLSGAAQEASKGGYKIEVRLDSPEGMAIGSTTFKVGGSKPPYLGMGELWINPVGDGKKHQLFFITRPAEIGEPSAALMNMEFRGD